MDKIICSVTIPSLSGEQGDIKYQLSCLCGQYLFAVLYSSDFQTITIDYFRDSITYH